MRNTSFSPLCAAFLLLILLSPLAAGAAQPQKPVSSPLTITVQEAEPGQMLLLGSSPEDSDLRVGALICRPLAEQAVDRKKTGGGLRLDVPLEWLDGYVAARSGKEDLPFQLWQQGEQWTSSLPIRLHDACAAAPMSRLTERWQAVREKLSRQKLSQPCRWSSGGTAIRPSRKPAPTVPWSWGTWPPKAMPCWSGATSIPASR